MMPLIQPLRPELREVKAEFPDDMTEEEFWNFVCLAGTSIFGMQTEIKDNETLHSWDMISWLKRNIKEIGNENL